MILLKLLNNPVNPINHGRYLNSYRPPPPGAFEFRYSDFVFKNFDETLLPGVGL